jgi:hypothetical protein
VHILDPNRAAAAARRNWSLRGAWGDQGEAAGGLGARAPSEDALTVAQLEEEGHPIARTASVVAAQDLLGEFTVPRHPRRARPRRRRLTIAPGLPHQSSGRGAAAQCIAPLPLPIGAAVSRPRLDRRPRLEREIPLRVFNLSRRSENWQLSFNESPWTRGPAAVDPVYRPWTYSTDFLIEKYFWKFAAPGNFTKDPWTFLKLYLVPKNLHMGLCINFYIDN